MAPRRLTFPIFALIVAAFCCDLQAGLLSLVPVEMQSGLHDAPALASAMAMPWEDEREGHDSPRFDGQPSELKGFPDPRGTQVLPVACGALEVTWQPVQMVCFIAPDRWLVFQSLAALQLLKVPISTSVGIITEEPISVAKQNSLSSG